MDRNEKKKINFDEGAVTFLDVLGWKGIWNKQGNNPVNNLVTLIREIQEESQNLTSESQKKLSDSDRGVDIITKVLSISDTIAIFTKGPAHISIPIHTQVCSKAISSSIMKEIPLRGAISYGRFYIYDNIMVGPAVDEAASWHESINWIGVVLTPSCLYNYSSCKKIETVESYSSIPYKRRVDHLKLCVNWNFKDKEQLYRVCSAMGPHTPEIADKYLNTIAFLERENV